MGSLHAFVLMDDAVIKVTSKEMCERKMTIVLQYCNDYGVIINENKAKKIATDNEERDKQDMRVAGVSVSYSDSYISIRTL